MSYCKTSYETSVGKIFNMKELDRTLREALITGGLISRSFGVEKVGTQKAVFVIGGSADENQIPPFIHPYLIENFKGEDILVTDIRLFRTTNQEYISEREFESAVRNKTEYALSKARAILSLLWLDPSECEKLRSRFQFAGRFTLPGSLRQSRVLMHSTFKTRPRSLRWGSTSTTPSLAKKTSLPRERSKQQSSIPLKQQNYLHKKFTLFLRAWVKLAISKRIA